MIKQLRTLLVVVSTLTGLATALAQPANDNFANRTTISGFSAGFSATTASATKEAGEPNHAGNNGGRSVWYEWTPTVTANVTITSDGIGYRTLLAAYRGSAVNSLGTAVDSDIEPNFGAASISFSATSGVPHRIVVDVRNTGNLPNGGTFNFSLNQAVFPVVTMTAPANGQTFTNPALVTISANATATVGTITNVSFFYGGNNLIGSDTSSPYSVVWSNMNPGTYTVTARATDSGGRSTTPGGRTITIRPEGYFVTPLIHTNSIWRYLDNGSDQGTAWQAWGFNDSSWASGPGQLGYSTNAAELDEATVVSYGPDPANKYVTTYFRHAFMVTNAAFITNLFARVWRDDGVTVYLNGVEVQRNGNAAGAGFQDLAQNAGDDGYTVYTTNINAALLTNGLNVIAAEVHQSDLTSSDLSFHLELFGEGANNNLPPTVSITNPLANTTFPIGANIAISATASDSDGTVTNVAFYAGATFLGNDTTEPYSVTWMNAPQGVYTLTAVARDDEGGSQTSAGVNIVVNDTFVVPVTLIPTGSVWRYLDNGTDQGTAWTALSFSDGSWNSGPAELGYGDHLDAPSRPEATVVEDNSTPGYSAGATDRYITTYFRRNFTITNAAAVSNLVIVGSSRVDLQACKLEYSIVSPK